MTTLEERLLIALIPVSIILPVFGMADIKYSYENGINDYTGIVELTMSILTGIITGYMINRYTKKHENRA